MKFLEDLMVPTESNQFLPRVLSPAAFLIYLILTSLFVVSPAYVRYFQLANLSSPPSFSGEDLLRLVNSSRSALGLPPLSANDTLVQAAKDKAEDIFAKQYFAHVSPDQKTPWDFIRARQYQYSAAGENLALDFVTAQEAHTGLMNSESHKSNILSPLYAEIGIAVIQGTFENRPSILVVEFFGKQRVQAAAVPVKPASPEIAPKQEPKPQVITVSQSSSAPVLPVPLRESPVSKQETQALAETSTMIAPSLLLGEEVSTAMDSSCSNFFYLNCAWVRVLGGLLALILLAALLSLRIKTGTIPPEVAFRAIIFLVMLGYVVGRGAMPIIKPNLPSAVSILEV